VQSIAYAFLAAALVAGPVYSDDKHHQSNASQSKAASALTEGEIRRVDKKAKTVTIKHRPIEELRMPAMTMMFEVKDPAMLDHLKAGDKVRFRAERSGGDFTVTKIEPLK
jgi:Cu(I)/Ag(I) efflux system protein CusF